MKVKDEHIRINIGKTTCMMLRNGTPEARQTTAVAATARHEHGTAAGACQMLK
jgi:phage anti-repressor protein